jgi:DNA-binding transcriptional regulator/RsmH inhibitor MraZ
MMAQGAGIDREAVLIGSWDRFEIWNPARYEAASRVDDALASEAFKLI